jgi:hypothetical protein
LKRPIDRWTAFQSCESVEIEILRSERDNGTETDIAAENLSRHETDGSS